MTSALGFNVSDHPWLARTTTLAEYVNPEYYDDILLPYVFEPGDDLDMLRAHVRRRAARQPVRDVLELGIGTGRVTDALRAIVTPESYQAVDLSSQMIEFCHAKYSGGDAIGLVQSDSIQYLLDSARQFDFVFSLWSFNHSVHQNLVFREDGAQRVRQALRRLVMDLLRPGGTFFLIHVDVLSDEQRILTRQWNRITQVFTEGEQSPSKAHIDAALEELTAEGHVHAEVRHLVGQQIQYDSLEQAMETFLNFHLECYFNDRPELPEVFTQVQDYLRDFVTPDGPVRVAPGCFVYELTRPGGTGSA
jgi:ubiquinone/menaquinone biosynthesis C-methylase UbiE